jgi:aminoglycoside phosphotransferase (APT) family kinase protein
MSRVLRIVSNVCVCVCQEFLARYCSLSGQSPPSPEDWAFYIALSLFRLTAILAGVQARAKQVRASQQSPLSLCSKTC